MPNPFVTMNITPKSGTKFSVPNVIDCSYSVERSPGVDGALGQTYYDVLPIRVRRRVSLPGDGLAQVEGETIKLAAATGQNAYFKGEVTLARADDPAAVIRTLRWDKGHICRLTCDVDGDEIIESFDVSVTSLTIDDQALKRAPSAKS